MKGKHKIEVRSGRVVFTIELERNITILRGDSATGKTTLVEMLQAYETYGRQSGVTVSCDKPCRVLSGVNWELQLNATHDSIMFVDEGSTFVSSLDFARAIQHSDNYYVLVTREDLSTLPYSVNAILELKKTTSRFKRTYNKAYPIYDSLTASNVQLEGVEKLLTEDANSGYQLFTKIGEKYGIVCISAAGKDNIKQKIFPMKSEKVLVIADGAAFGPQMNDIYRLMQEDSTKFSLYLPESLEWLLLKADCSDSRTFLKFWSIRQISLRAANSSAGSDSSRTCWNSERKTFPICGMTRQNCWNSICRKKIWRRSLRRWSKAN